MTKKEYDDRIKDSVLPFIAETTASSLVNGTGNFMEGLAFGGAISEMLADIGRALFMYEEDVEVSEITEMFDEIIKAWSDHFSEDKGEKPEVREIWNARGIQLQLIVDMAKKVVTA